MESAEYDPLSLVPSQCIVSNALLNGLAADYAKTVQDVSVKC